MEAGLPARLRILIVDDRDEIHVVLTRILRRLGAASIASATTGVEALELIGRADPPFDVAILDIDLPTDDGLVCIRKLAAGTSRPALVLISGKDPLVLESARRLGQNLGLRVLGSLSKPVEMKALANLLEKLEGASTPSQVHEDERLTSDEVRLALAAGEFELWFQPQYFSGSGLLYGVEGLLRLRRRERVVLPGAFIRTAEESGLMGPLTDFVIEEAARWAATWTAAGHQLVVAVNLSKAGLEDLTLPDRAAGACTARGVAPSQITIELTESTLAARTSAVLDIVTRFRLKGFRLSLDDFGAGYASLEELRLLPFHELKIDKQFVQAALSDERARAILENSIGLARDLHLATVAEGVETEEMLAEVSRLGIHIIQGYLLGRPMPPQNVLNWRRTRQAVAAAPSPITEPPGHSETATPVSPAMPFTTTPFSADTVLRFAHDVASPLMMVMTLSELLLEDDADHGELRHDLTQIHNSAREVATMVKALQTLARRAATNGR